MCITTLDSILESTVIGVWDIHHPGLGYRHVIAYQNSPTNLGEGPNCMILPIPTAEPLQASDILDTSDCPQLLSIMTQSALYGFRNNEVPKNLVMRMGIYHIAILNELDNDAVQNCLSNIPPNKIPVIEQEFIEFYKEKYPGFSLLLCCFDNKDKEDASPIMVHFPPKYPWHFQCITLDGHGRLPEVGKNIAFHQKILVGAFTLSSLKPGFSHPINLASAPSELLPFLPAYGFTESLEGYFPNYDMILQVKPISKYQTVRPQFGFLAEIA